jgi:hypothetical protein
MAIYTDSLQESAEVACLDRKEEGRDPMGAVKDRSMHRVPIVAPAIPAPIVARRPAFLANRRLDLGKMRDALASRDFAAIQHIGHNCKGIGTGYGFPDISTIGSRIEIAARALNVIELEKLIRQFAECIQSACSDQTD